MDFQSIVSALEIKAYPEALNGVYETLTPGKNAVTDTFVGALEERYGILGEYTEELKEAARALLSDEVRLAFVNTVCAYLPGKSIDEARDIPMPRTDGTLLGNMLPLLILLSQVPAAYEEYVSRGFSEQEAKRYMSSFCAAIKTVEQRFNIHGINSAFYNWLCVYMKCRIFRAGIFDIEMRTMPSAAMYLKNRTTGETAALMCEGRFHRTGHVLGSAGFADEEGAFDADFTETEDAFVGHAAKGGYVLSALTSFPKSQWDVVVRPGDDVISLHIPAGVSMTPENIKSSVDEAMAYAKKRYPECKPKCTFCASWLLDPNFGGLLGDTSKIVGFGQTFLRYPMKSTGIEMFSFVFPGADRTKLEALPETTSLHRKLKALYLSGGFVHVAAGIIPN